MPSHPLSLCGEDPAGDCQPLTKLILSPLTPILAKSPAKTPTPGQPHSLTLDSHLGKVGPSRRGPLPPAVQRELVPGGREERAGVEAVEKGGKVPAHVNQGGEENANASKWKEGL
jgi:hypothetical protein